VAKDTTTDEVKSCIRPETSPTDATKTKFSASVSSPAKQARGIFTSEKFIIAVLNSSPLLNS